MVPLAARDLIAIHGRPLDFPVIAYAAWAPRGRRKPVLVGYGGLCWRFPSPDPESARRRCDIWLELERPDLINPLALVRWARRMLRTAAQVGETSVYCIRDDEPNSAKLLALAGLERMDGDVDITFDNGSKRTGEVWRRQASQLSHPS
jgi:hypothetical protein